MHDYCTNTFQTLLEVLMTFSRLIGKYLMFILAVSFIAVGVGIEWTVSLKTQIDVMKHYPAHFHYIFFIMGLAALGVLNRLSKKGNI